MDQIETVVKDINLMGPTNVDTTESMAFLNNLTAIDSGNNQTSPQNTAAFNLRKYKSSTTCWSSRLCYAINQIEKTKNEEFVNELIPDSSSFRDVNKMLSVAVTTIILLAKGRHNIPVENYMWTELFLKLIKDEKNNVPLNIENLLKHIQFIKKNNNIHWKNCTANDATTPSRRPSKIPIAKQISDKPVTSTPKHTSQLVDKRDINLRKHFSDPNIPNCANSNFIQMARTPMYNNIIYRLLFSPINSLYNFIQTKD